MCIEIKRATCGSFFYRWCTVRRNKRNYGDELSRNRRDMIRNHLSHPPFRLPTGINGSVSCSLVPSINRANHVPRAILPTCDKFEQSPDRRSCLVEYLLWCTEKRNVWLSRHIFHERRQLDLGLDPYVFA